MEFNLGDLKQAIYNCANIKPYMTNIEVRCTHGGEHTITIEKPATRANIRKAVNSELKDIKKRGVCFICGGDIVGVKVKKRPFGPTILIMH